MRLPERQEVTKLLDRTLSNDDYFTFLNYAPTRDRYTPGEHATNPIMIAPDGGDPYLYRWHVVPRNDHANVYLHIQVRSDPERPLHDHPYDNQSVILAGGYDELYATPWFDGISVKPGHPTERKVRRHDVVTRRAEEAHHLILPPDIPYTMTLFTTGPRKKDWGFWYPDGWHHHSRHTKYENGVSVHVPDTAS
jgi:hypothetical protein